ncbi:NAD(P)H-dependent oxidoreductase [Pseudorhodoplanes sp.]|jgi:chromate reductase|uniref:NADPH-dependent FMN reductase n=1 Tax=Pseudorhodoplanes sp. TaxID=1934341 RepID=UPI002C69D9C6|nr:NAD(P)H-dependent oxidoreductase [Pseudorhodoplanes sp.]HWV43758.1 NAD(P)H-dependent oxidoreductase [Pseudorhodoplanes sp.]
MPAPKILVFAGSIRTGSMNGQLAALAAKEFALAGADVTRISLLDYPMPLYDGDLESRSGPPAPAVSLKRMIEQHQGVFIASPEYNASVTPLLKNTLDWVSRVRDGNEAPLAAYRNRAFALGGASNGGYGAMRSLMALRQVLEQGCGALVIPDQIAVARAGEAFDEMDNFRDEANSKRLKAVVKSLIEFARHYA